MPAVQFKRMNWFQKVPLWKYNQAWRQHHAERTSRFLDNSASAINAFASAAANQIKGSVDLTTKITVDRIQAEVKAKAAARTDVLNAALIDLSA